MEIDLYDRHGHPVAYIADDAEHSIYLWDGHAVCYIDGDKIYGWKGHHIGWYISEIIYDIHGARVGFTKNTCPTLTYTPPIKYIKYIKYVKYIKCIPYMRPFFTTSYSSLSLSDFLKQDAII